METSVNSEDVRILIDPLNLPRKINCDNHENFSLVDKNASSIKDKKCASFEKLSSRENKEISDFLNAIEKPSEKFHLKKEFYAEPVPIGSWHQFNESEEADVRHSSGVFPHSWAPLGPSPSSGLGRHRSQHKFQKYYNLKKNPLSVTEGMVYTIPEKYDRNASSKSFQLHGDKKAQKSLKIHSEDPERSGPVFPNHRDEIARDANAKSFDDKQQPGSGSCTNENSSAVVPDGRRTSVDESKRGLLKMTNQVERGGSSVKVAFFLGADDMEAGGEAEPKLASEVASPSKGPKIRKHGGRHKSGSRVFGSEVLLESSRHVRSDADGGEGDDLDDVHRNVMASHRFDNAKGLRHRKVDRKSFASRRDSELKNNRKALVVDLPEIAAIPEEDDVHHKMFVELDELRLGEGNEWEWRERARWIKFEEEVEEGACRWGKPHVSSLSFHSLVELRRCIEHGAVVLDLDADDLPTIMSRVADQLVITDQLSEDKKPFLLQILLLKHKHMYEQQSFIKRTQQLQNLSSLVQSQNALQSSTSVMASDGEVTLRLLEHDDQTDRPVLKESKTSDDGKIVEEMLEEEFDLNEQESCVPALCGIERGMTQSSSSKSLPSSPSSSSPFARKYSMDAPHILKRIPLGAEATNVLVGPATFLDKPVTVFVRLRNAVCLNSVTEVPLPVRFLFLLLGPDDNVLDYHEIGRSLSTLMADGRFHDAAYVATNRSDILDSLNEFLNDSIVLPPGEWDKKTLLPIVNITKEKQREKDKQKVKKVKDHPAYDPLKRTGRHFGGLVEDVKHRYPYYWSDIKDGLNLQCLAAFFFVYFACLSPAITFGGLLGEKTDKMMGVNEMLVATAICGVIFSLAAGQPLVIIGATGPVLVFEEALFKICHAFGLEFLPFRVWVSIWVSIITLFGVMWECSVLVRFITRFTEEVFALLISLIFIYEVFKKLFYIFHKNPLLEFYPPQGSSIINNFLCSSLRSEFADFNVTNDSSIEVLHLLEKSADNNASDISLVFGVNTSLVDISNNRSFANFTALEELRSSCRFDGPEHLPHPNTALFSVVLTFGTFLLAYVLKSFRNSKFLGRNARRAIGDFGVPISIFLVALTDYFTPNTYTEKLDVPEGFSPTASSKRSWFINPLGVETTLPLWSILAAAIPSVLIFILLYMESVITSMIVNKKDRCLKKGSGYHLDLFVTGMCATVCGFLGLPFMCSATVRSVTHVSALAVFSRTHAPGDKPHLVRVHEQRLTSLAVHLLVGVSVLMGPVLGNVPTAVLFGIFLYMGIASMSGIQLLKRLKLMFMPVKHHPDVGYVKKVRLWKMNLFTCLQLIFLAVLWVVKSSKGALAFPFILILIIPVRIHLFKFIFTERELRELDNEEDCTSDDEQDEPDFYTQAHMPM